MKRILLSLLLALASFGALAAGSITTTVSEGIADTNGYYRVYLPSGITGSPGCATTPQQFAIDPSTQVGKNMMALLVTAMYAGKTVQFTGTGTCTLYGTIETISVVVVVN